ncbi:putative AAA family ATPase y4kL [Colletotrichum sp. SAR 10_66]|nr:putative AAA family ATPase y4kL [Colletotrichum sp. SAR 10_66]
MPPEAPQSFNRGGDILLWPRPTPPSPQTTDNTGEKATLSQLVAKDETKDKEDHPSSPDKIESAKPSEDAATAQPRGQPSKPKPADGPTESKAVLSQHVAHLQHKTLGKQLFDREKQMGRFGVRAQQAVLDHTFTHMRIEELEKQVKDLRAIINGADTVWEPPTPDEMYPVHRHQLLRVPFDQFRLTKNNVALPTNEKAALEVQISENVSSAGAEYSSSPERLRIRSRALLSHLDKLVGASLMIQTSPPQVVGNIEVYNSIVFLRPFKFFVGHIDDIKGSVQAVKSAAEAEEAKKAIPSQVLEQLPKRHKGKKLQQMYLYKDLLPDLECLVEFLDTDLKPTMILRQQIADGTATEIEYADLWHLFKRGDFVIPQEEQHHAYRIFSIAGGREPLSYRKFGNEEKPIRVDGFVLDCISMASNGHMYVPKIKRMSIKKFFGRKPITSLPVYPMRFDKNYDTLRKKFIGGGKRFVNLTNRPFCHKMFKGRTLDDLSHDLEAQVIVDMALAVAQNPDWLLKSSVSTDSFTRPDPRETRQDSWCKHGTTQGCCGGDVIHRDGDTDEFNSQIFLGEMSRYLGPRHEKDLTEDDLMLMQHYVHAFVLRSRQWVTVPTDKLSDVEFSNSFDDLVLPDNHSKTVRALVDTHESLRATRSSGSLTGNPLSIGSCLDLVKGKGAGLVILLHGPPGVGKTSTAECVADDTKRPLFPITCGDIGETALEVEKNLQYNFQLAHKWGCVLLLDEADVFLAKRTRSDLRHNAVTSVFLRTLEYYAGILFLTTNRVGTMDPAFKSRIQVSLFYPKLNLKVTKELYRKFIKRAKDEQISRGHVEFEIKKSEIMDFAKEHFRDLEKNGRDTWNGRQIRNAFQTAIALAEHKAKKRIDGEPVPVLGEEQFKIVAEGYAKFDEYLVSAMGASEAEWANRDRWRADPYTTIPAYTQMPPQVVPLTTEQRPAYVRSSARKVPASGQDSSTEESESETDSEDDESDQRRGNTKSRRGKGTGLGPGLPQSRPPGLSDGEWEAYQKVCGMYKLK